MQHTSIRKCGLGWKKRPRITVHFTPTSSSWLNMVERFFADLTADVIRAGSFSSANVRIPMKPQSSPWWPKRGKMPELLTQPKTLESPGKWPE
jgi:hypothetical protein